MVQYERQHERAQDWRDNWDHRLFLAEVEAAAGAVRAALTINGAAAVALLAFCGAQKAFDQTLLRAAVISMASFGFGVLASAIAAGYAYKAQRAFRDAHNAPSDEIAGLKDLAVRRRAVATACIVVSYIAFVGGVAAAAVGLWRQQQGPPAVVVAPQPVSAQRDAPPAQETTINQVR
jgi:hypothetical protein